MELRPPQLSRHVPVATRGARVHHRRTPHYAAVGGYSQVLY